MRIPLIFLALAAVVSADSYQMTACNTGSQIGDDWTDVVNTLSNIQGNPQGFTNAGTTEIGGKKVYVMADVSHGSCPHDTLTDALNNNYNIYTNTYVNVYCQYNVFQAGVTIRLSTSGYTDSTITSNCDSETA
jgi:predicted small secreted protein